MSNSTKLLIHKAEILLPNGEFLLGDVLIEHGKISQIAPSIDVDNNDGNTILDASGLTLLPGVIDPQVHFREPGLEYKEDLFTASCACAKGGVTSFLEMPNTIPLTTNQINLNDKLSRANSKSLVNYGFFIGANGQNLEELNTAEPVCGIKIFMGSMHGPLLVSQRESLEAIFAQGIRLIAVHAEDQARIEERRKKYLANEKAEVSLHSLIQDEIAALNATKLAIELANKYQRRLHILHLSTGIEAEFLRQHKQKWITAEVTPQHLLLSSNSYAKLGSLAQMNPPLRSFENQDILWQALLDGVIDMIATDHAPHTLEEKSKPYPNSPSGMPGVETSLPLMLTQAKLGRCSVAQVASWMSINVAKGYSIPNKGLIATGYDADLVLVDLNNYHPVLKEELKTKCGWSSFEGWNLTGWPIYTIVNGSIVYAKGKLNTQTRGRALEFTSNH